VVTIEMSDASGSTERIQVDTLLVAVGRRAVTDGLGAEEAGLVLEGGLIRVDDAFRTSVPGISAIGDVITTGSGVHQKLAHLSSAEGIILAERLAGQSGQPLNYDQVPACTYCDPEIGSVGLTEASAAERGHDVRVGTFPIGVLGRARIAGELEGFVKIVAEKTYDQVLGIHIIGARATELMGEASVALRLESTVEELMRTIHAHPTISEAMGEAAHAVHGGAIHI
jgi:dihydrolipoamide dehydrogenase